MLLYESAALVHGRPYPLDGEAYENAFVHFRPESGWDYRPSQLLEDYLPTKLTVLNTVPLSGGAAAGGRRILHLVTRRRHVGHLMTF